MAKKNLTSLMNGIMGNPEPQDEAAAQTSGVIEQSADETTSEITEDMKESLESKRYRNVGRPKKGARGSKKEETRATFIVDPELIRKLKYISLVESSLLKEVIAEALTGYIDAWEAKNGKIKLPKKKLI